MSFITSTGSGVLNNQLFLGGTDSILISNGVLRKAKAFTSSRAILESTHENVEVESDSVVISYTFRATTSDQIEFIYFEHTDGNWLASISCEDVFLPAGYDVTYKFRCELSDVSAEFYRILGGLSNPLLDKIKLTSDGTDYVLDILDTNLIGESAVLFTRTDLEDQSLSDVSVGYINSSDEYVEVVQATSIRSNDGASGRLELQLVVNFNNEPDDELGGDE